MKYFDEDRFIIDNPSTFKGKMFDEDQFEISYTEPETVQPETIKTEEPVEPETIKTEEPVDPNYEMTAFDDLRNYLVGDDVKQTIRNFLPRAVFATETGGSPVEIAGSTVGDLATTPGRGIRALALQDFDSMADLEPTTDGLVSRTAEGLLQSPTLPIALATGGLTSIPALALSGAVGGLADEAYATEDSDVVDYVTNAAIGGLTGPALKVASKGAAGAAKGVVGSIKDTFIPKGVSSLFNSKIPVKKKLLERKFIDKAGKVSTLSNEEIAFDILRKAGIKSVKAKDFIIEQLRLGKSIDYISDKLPSIIQGSDFVYDRAMGPTSLSATGQFGFEEKLNTAKDTYKDMMMLKDMLIPDNSNADNLRQSGEAKIRGQY